MLRFLALLFLASLIPPQPAHAVEAQVSGAVRVIDGDTFDIAGTRVRLFGIDAPEGDQPCRDDQDRALRCGDWVTAQVRTSFSGAQARCSRVDTDRYGRMVARCSVAGQDVGQTLVASGLAFAYAEYSGDYVETEGAAIREGRGIHAYQLIRPAIFRASKQNDSAVEAAPARGANGCTIKGNISSKGVRIFHVAGQRDYDKTSIRTDKGERWFCSAADARKAGWRAAKR